jgi:putative glutamine amidotransferase
LPKPLVGITTYLEPSVRWNGWDQSAALLPVTYHELVQRAGGLAVLLPPDGDPAAAEETVSRMDAVVIAGGPDVAPARYGSEPHPQTNPPTPHRDAWEIALTAAALAHGLPLLGICRGLQVLNVARGGTLHQHLPDLAEEIGHRQSPTEGTTHDVVLSPDSRLAKLLGSSRLEVNSYHHQGIDELGEGLRVVGHAPDGVAEAVEGASNGFVFGVQWHAEALIERPEQLALFEGLVRAGADRAQRSPEAA